VVERRAAEVAEERPRRHAAQQVTAQSGVLRERATTQRARERVRRRVDRHVLVDVRQPVRAVVTAGVAARERTMDPVDQHRVPLESDRFRKIRRTFAAAKRARRMRPLVFRQFVSVRKLFVAFYTPIDRVVACGQLLV